MFTEIKKEIKSLMNPRRTQTIFWKNEESSYHIWKNSIKTKTNWTRENEKELKQVKWLCGKLYQQSGSRRDRKPEHEKNVHELKGVW